MRKKKLSLTYDAALFKELLSFAGPDYREVTRDVHDDLLACWGICQSVFAAAARPEHALSLLPLYRGAIDSRNALSEAPEGSNEDVEDEDEDEDEDDEGEEDDEDEEEDEYETFDAEAEVTTLDERPLRRR